MAENEDVKIWDEWYVTQSGWKSVDLGWLTGSIDEMAQEIGVLSKLPEIFYECREFSLFVFRLKPHFPSEAQIEKVKTLNVMLGKVKNSDDYDRFSDALDRFESESELNDWLYYFHEIHPSSHVVFVMSDSEGQTIFCESYPVMLEVVSKIREVASKIREVVSKIRSAYIGYGR